MEESRCDRIRAPLPLSSMRWPSSATHLLEMWCRELKSRLGQEVRGGCLLDAPNRGYRCWHRNRQLQGALNFFSTFSEAGTTLVYRT